MPRPATGTVIEKVGKDGKTYRGLRFTAYGKRRYTTLGTMPREDAEPELRHVLADVERANGSQPAPTSSSRWNPRPSRHSTSTSSSGGS